MISWIWVVQGMARDVDKDGLLHECMSLTTARITDEFLLTTIALSIKWCKSRAQKLCWSKEVDLLQEEMRRVLETLEWEAQEWDAWGLVGVVEAMSPDHAEGILAYTS